MNSDNERNSNKIKNFELTKNIGLNNIGHSCYMNSFLQILMHIPNFLPNLKKYNKDNINEDTLVYNLIELSENPKNNEFLYNMKKIISLKYPKYKDFVQNDSQNFAIDFIDTIIDETKNEEDSSYKSESIEENIEIIKNDKESIDFKKEKFLKFKLDCENGEKNFIEKLFIFYDSIISYKNKLIDPKCIRFNLLLNIELTFPIDNSKNIYTLYELLDNKYTNSKKYLEMDEKRDLNKNKRNLFNFSNLIKNIYLLIPILIMMIFKDSKNVYIISIIIFLLLIGLKTFNKNIHLSKEKENSNNLNDKSLNIIKISSLPEILIISFIRGIEGKNIINSFVSFNDILEMRNYIDEDLYDIKLGTKYNLYSINIREGNEKSFGHCFSYVKVGKDWICFNDNHTNLEKPKFSLENVIGLYYIKNNL